jgi:hypothetical protein
MRREFVLGAVMATVMAVGLGAQTTPPSSSPTTPPSTSQSPSERDQSSSGKEVTVTGCLMSADQWKGGTAGTAGTTGATGAPGSTSASRSSGSGGFVLTDVSMGASTGSYSSPSTGTSPSASAGGASSSTNADKNALMLTGKDDDLQKNVGKRVEVKGTLDKSASSGDTSMTNPPSTAGTSGSMASGGTLRVTSVKETSGSCSGGGNR